MQSTPWPHSAGGYLSDRPVRRPSERDAGTPFLNRFISGHGTYLSCLNEVPFSLAVAAAGDDLHPNWARPTGRVREAMLHHPLVCTWRPRLAGSGQPHIRTRDSDSRRRSRSARPPWPHSPPKPPHPRPVFPASPPRGACAWRGPQLPAPPRSAGAPPGARYTVPLRGAWGRRRCWQRFAHRRAATSSLCAGRGRHTTSAGRVGATRLPGCSSVAPTSSPPRRPLRPPPVPAGGGAAPR